MKIDDLTPPVAVPEPAWKQQLAEFWQQADDIRKIDLQVLLKMGDGDGARQLIESWQQEVVERRKKRARKKVKKKAKSAPVKYAWGGYWTPGYNFGDTELGGAGDGGGGESVREAVNTGMAQGSMIGDAGAQSTWDGVSPDTQMTVNEDSSSAIEDFVKFCAKELNIDQLPKLRLRRDPAWSERNHSFGQFDPARGELNVSVAGRHIMDVFRTVAHELVHYRQNEQKELPADAGATGSRYENEANAQAGVLMRNYAQLHPEYFEEASAVSEAADSSNKKQSTFQWSDWATIDPETGFGLPMESIMSLCEAQLAKNKILLESNSQRSVSYFTDLFNLGQTPQVGSTYLMTLLMLVDDKILVGNEPTIVKVIEQTGVDEFVVEKSDGSVIKFPYEAVKDRVIYHTFFFNNRAEYNKLKIAIKMKFDTNLSESSGYIPTARERNDPRFKMALSPDVQPGATGKNANRLGLKTGAQGEPTLLMKELRNALREFKETDQLPLTEDQDLFEIDMSPSNLRKLVRDIDARAGIEFEMIVPGVQTDEDEDLEPDYDTDERVSSISDAEDFFFDGGYNGRRDIRGLVEAMREEYYEWQQEQLDEDWDREGQDYLRDYIDNNDLFDRDDHMEEAQEYVRDMLADEDNPVDEQSDQFLDAVTERLDQLADEFVEREWDGRGTAYDYAREQFDEEKRDDYDEGEWLISQGMRYMSDVQDRYSDEIQWPYWRGGGGDGEMDIDAVAEDFSNAIGRPVNAASRYHGARREAGTYVVEPDGSLSGDEPGDGGLEFVSPPLPLDELLSDMDKVRKWAKGRGCYTNSSTGLHMNVSVPNTSTAKLDYVKLALLLGDEHVLQEFGRASNTYAGSALKKIREILKNNPGSAAEVLNKMRNHMEALATKVIHSGETQKFTSINTKGDYVEFRSPGGDWLDDNWDKVTPTLLRTVVALDAAMDPNKYRQEYQKKLYKLLDSSQERLASPNVNKLLSMYFTDDSEGGSREIAVQLAKELLVKRDPSRKVPEPQPADGEPAAPGSGRWGLWITGLGKFARRGDERLEFDTREAARDWYADEAMMRPGIRSDVEVREIPAEPGRSYEIYNLQTGEALEQFQAADDAAAVEFLNDYRSQGPHRLSPADAARQFAVRIGASTTTPAPAQTDQGSGARTYRVFTAHNNQTVGTFQSDGIHGSTNANIAFRNYLRSIGRESAAGFNYELIGSERPQAAAQQTAAAPAADALPPTVPLDIEIAAPRTLTTPGQPQQQFTGNWLVKDADGNILATFSGIGNVQADANRVAMGWLRQNPQYMQDGVEVVPEMSE
jgi:hypothetical protein